MSVIGNKHQLAFELVPVSPSWETRYSAEAAAWAGLAVWIEGQNICAHIPSGSHEVIDYFYVPLIPLIDWLTKAYPALQFEERAAAFATGERAHESLRAWGNANPRAGFDEESWLAEREGWWQRHFLAAGADGARVPNVAFVRSDVRCVMQWEEPRTSRYSSIEMLHPAGSAVLAWDDVSGVLGEFTGKVASWIREAGLIAQYPWAELDLPLQAPGMDSAIAYFTCRPLEELCGIFRRDSYEQLLEFLSLTDAADPASAPQCQMLRDMSPSLDPSTADALCEVGDRIGDGNPESHRRWQGVRSLALDRAQGSKNEIEAGQWAAEAVREHMRLDGEPIRDVGDLLRDVGVESTHMADVAGRDDHMIVGAREDGSPVAATLNTPRMNEPWARNFEAARALGHLLLDPVRGGAIGAAMGSFAQSSRRRRSGSFSAELLLPESAIAKESGFKLDGITEGSRFTFLMERYGLGARAVAYHIWNRGWLSSELVRDDLIDSYASLRN